MKLPITVVVSFLVSVLVTSCTGTAPNLRTEWPSDAELEQYNAIVPFAQQIACVRERELGSRFSYRTCYRMSDYATRRKETTALVNAIQETSRYQSASSF